MGFGVAAAAGLMEFPLEPCFLAHFGRLNNRVTLPQRGRNDETSNPNTDIRWSFCGG